jgi:signal recognition particle GTPase
MDENDQPKSLVSKFTEGLRKARDLFKKEGRLVDNSFLAELRAILIRTDMGPSAAGTIVDEIDRQFRARRIHLDDILAVIKARLRATLC